MPRGIHVPHLPHGRLAEQLDVQAGLPSVWTPACTAKFIKDRYGGDPFTVIAFTGGDATGGFVVLELPRAFFAPYDHYGMVMTVSIGIVIRLCSFGKASSAAGLRHSR